MRELEKEKDLPVMIHLFKGVNFMKIYENENVLGCYLLKCGPDLLLVQYRDFNPQRQKKEINLDEWTEITELKK